MSSPRRLLGLECDVQRLNVSLNVGRAVGASLRRKDAAMRRYVTKQAWPKPDGVVR